MIGTTAPRQTSPAYLRELATTYSRSSKPTAQHAATRLREIAVELEELQAMSEGVTPATSPTARNTTAGTDVALARLRAAAAATPPTPEQMAELRALRRAKP